MHTLFMQQSMAAGGASSMHSGGMATAGVLPRLGDVDGRVSGCSRKNSRDSIDEYSQSIGRPSQPRSAGGHRRSRAVYSRENDDSFWTPAAGTKYQLGSKSRRVSTSSAASAVDEGTGNERSVPPANFLASQLQLHGRSVHGRHLRQQYSQHPGASSNSRPDHQPSFKLPQIIAVGPDQSQHSLYQNNGQGNGIFTTPVAAFRHTHNSHNSSGSFPPLPQASMLIRLHQTRQEHPPDTRRQNDTNGGGDLDVTSTSSSPVPTEKLPHITHTHSPSTIHQQPPGTPLRQIQNIRDHHAHYQHSTHKEASSYHAESPRPSEPTTKANTALYLPPLQPSARNFLYSQNPNNTHIPQHLPTHQAHGLTHGLFPAPPPSRRPNTRSPGPRRGGHARPTSGLNDAVVGHQQAGVENTLMFPALFPGIATASTLHNHPRSPGSRRLPAVPPQRNERSHALEVESSRRS
ncbi:uncharacterized protein EV422DRAFT_355888 [Fimicolochytrium jonesii]|uniref:uncharacterized protein n=1 Tax=Fimicolochytrium jonesii TaxID=1396493 RepID=UPI0022FE16AE|nr:uncharacterized protein EV422DRAFT_355888 [Fimicolochytrium jonesii]KAI8823448.1 hypothetical protein EV422DRAFT_355888 [Fimicolochytrium jonesii]